MVKITIDLDKETVFWLKVRSAGRNETPDEILKAAIKGGLEGIVGSYDFDGSLEGDGLQRESEATRHVIENDPDPEVRELARRHLEGLDAIGACLDKNQHGTGF